MAAGLGFKTFTTGEVLTAADTNGYLMQGVLVFASAAARDAAITSPQEGQCCYLKDTDAVLTYSGSAWVGFDDSNAIQNSIVDAKGDLIAASAADTPARLAVGTNDNFLQAASGEATGLKWGGAWTTYTPVLTGPALGNGSISARYLKIGKMVTVEVRFALGSTSTIGADNFISLPFNAAQGAGLTIPVTLMDFGTTQFMGIGYLQYADTIRLLVANTSTTYGSAALVTSTVPFTWTTNDYIAFVITYEVA